MRVNFSELTSFAIEKHINNKPKETESGGINYSQFIGLPFWCSNDTKRGFDSCCFQHYIGLPIKNDEEYPLFDYEILVVDSIQKYQHVWIKKSRGLGITELILRYLAWISLSSHKLENKSIFIIAGTREEFANILKKRLERLFERRFPNIEFDSKYTELMLNKTWIKIFPTTHVKDIRGYTDVSYLFLDEADYFEKTEQNELPFAIKSYEEKSRGKIIMVSTPYRPDGLFSKIEKNEMFTNFFHKLFFDYRYGLNKIYDNDFIEKEKNAPEFGREYDLQYLGNVGNVYSQLSITAATERPYPDLINKLTPKVMCIDEGFSTSKFAIIVGQWVKGDKQMQIIHAEELDKPLFEDAINHIFYLREKYGNVLNIAFDGSRPELGRSIKRKIGERDDWQYIQDTLLYCKKNKLDVAKQMIVVPIVFSTESKSVMTYHSRRLLDDPRGRIAIDKRFDKLITGMRAAVFDDTGKLNKEESPYNDLLDCFQMMTMFIKWEGKE